jgi:preprotein translocase subunit SecE
MNAKDITADSESPGSADTSGGSGGDGNDFGGSGPRSGGAIEGLPARATLGLARWVQYVFVVAGLFFLWFLDKVITLAWSNFAEPPTTAITAIAAIAGLGGAVALYKNERVHTLVTDVVTELAKVTWPTRSETYTSTVVVIVTSLIAAAIVGAFDFVWSFFTDLLYKHKV